MSGPKCRFSGRELKHTFVDLGKSPLANSYLRKEDLGKGERFFPLHAFVSDDNFLVQLEEFETPEGIFGDYAYFSSFSDSWLKHAKAYTDLMVQRFGFDSKSQVIEIASNDGYLLQYFKEKGVPVLGVEPAANVAEYAVKKGIPSIVRFFGVKTARELVEQGKRADLLLGNNVLAHVPDLNDFVGGMKIVLKDSGVITMEFPHLYQLMKFSQFDTIYHEHFSYFSFTTVERVFAHHGMTLFDVEEIPTHGGSLRIYGRHTQNTKVPVGERVAALKKKEEEAGLTRLETYLSFGEKAKKVKQDLLSFLIDAKRRGESVAAYGAAAKGNTMFNYCGIKTDFIDYIVDRSPHKQNLYLPGTQIPIHAPEKIGQTKPDYLLIVPWNIKDEIMQQMAHIREWGGKFVTPIPTVQVHD